MRGDGPRGPLAGIRVVEPAGIGPGPFAGMILAEMGADVVRVDRPARGVLDAAEPAADLLGRGKRSIVLDLKRPEAVAALLDLCDTADVLLEGFRPGVAERLGLGPDRLHARNARLVYGRMTGWGQDGPDAATAGHDIAYIAPTGALHAIGAAGGAPAIPLNLVGDLGGGAAYLVMGVLAAVLEARSTGRGQVVDAAIVDGTVHLLGIVHGLLADGRWSDERGTNLLDGGAPFYAVYRTLDGEHMAVGALEPQFFAAFVRLLGVDVDPADQADRGRWGDMRAAFAAAFATRTRREWTEVFAGSDACVAPVLSLREAAGHPHLAERRCLVEVDGVLQSMPAPRFSRHPRTAPDPAPAVGQHTAEVIPAGAAHQIGTGLSPRG
ncbi:CoA transferase [Actinomadura madurae]|uniref:CaiB/BaiF CoA transferase family protein n=1 Tax=Actinomadura madurae TaxID=1993 RepID=UPI002026B2F7|nr:CaiB/BaiF CoA-transferase family protein [Actinomadura madurae]URM99861.1 CoA transferase [Actinomadura madurae]